MFGPGGPGNLEDVVGVGQAGPVVVAALAAGLEAIAATEGLVSLGLVAHHPGSAEAESKEVERAGKVEVCRFADPRAAIGEWHFGLRACSGAAPTHAVGYAGRTVSYSPGPVEPGGLVLAGEHKAVAGVACSGAGRGASVVEGA